MKFKKILRNITIILTILIIILDIVLFVNTNKTYENMEMFSTIFNFGTFIYGIILIPIVWIQYFLLSAILKVYTKYIGIKKWIATSLLIILEIILVVIEIRILGVILLFMGIFN